MIVFDASTLVDAALKADSVPERALLRAEETDVFALSSAVEAEIAEVIARPKLAIAVPRERRERFLSILRGAAIWFEPAGRITDYRDPKDNKVPGTRSRGRCGNHRQQRPRPSDAAPP